LMKISFKDNDPGFEWRNADSDFRIL